MYINEFLLVLLLVVFFWMASELRTRKKKVQLLLWDIAELQQMSQWYLSVSTNLERSLIEAKGGGEADLAAVPSSYYNLRRRLLAYERYNVNFSIDASVIDDSRFFDDTFIAAHNIIRDDFPSHAGFGAIEKEMGGRKGEYGIYWSKLEEADE